MTEFHLLCRAVENVVGSFLSRAAGEPENLSDLATRIGEATGGVACCVISDGMLRVHVVAPGGHAFAAPYELPLV